MCSRIENIYNNTARSTFWMIRYDHTVVHKGPSHHPHLGYTHSMIEDNVSPGTCYSSSYRTSYIAVEDDRIGNTLDGKESRDCSGTGQLPLLWVKHKLSSFCQRSAVHQSLTGRWEPDTEHHAELAKQLLREWVSSLGGKRLCYATHLDLSNTPLYTPESHNSQFNCRK